jgi:NAD(P)-dependent dehydrogenase (short-subunit alcohol dehydrogenase family)
VRRLAANGASVALTYANSAEKAAETARAAEARGQPVIAIKADSTDPKAVADAVAQTLARFGHLDILVVNAGILIRGTVDTYDLADFDRMVATNVRGVFVAIQVSSPPPQGRWTDYHHRQQYRHSNCIPGSKCLLNDQGRGCLAGARHRHRPRATRDYGQ